MTPPPALLVVGHGMCDEAGAATLRSFVQMLGERSPGLPVGGGFTGENPVSSEPPEPASLSRAVSDLVERHAVRELAVIPLTLGRADQDDAAVERALEREEARHDGIGYAVWRGPLGPHPALLTALERRLDEALGNGHRSPSDRAATTVLLVGRGSADPEANAELYRTARLLWEGRGYASVEVAFVSHAAPDVPSGLDRCARLAAGVPGRRARDRGAAVLPRSTATCRTAPASRRRAGRRPTRRPRCGFAGVIGAAEELADLVLERYGGAAPGGPAGRQRGATPDRRGAARRTAPRPARRVSPAARNRGAGRRRRRCRRRRAAPRHRAANSGVAEPAPVSRGSARSWRAGHRPPTAVPRRYPPSSRWRRTPGRPARPADPPDLQPAVAPTWTHAGAARAVEPP